MSSLPQDPSGPLLPGESLTVSLKKLSQKFYNTLKNNFVPHHNYLSSSKDSSYMSVRTPSLSHLPGPLCPNCLFFFFFF